MAPPPARSAPHRRKAVAPPAVAACAAALLLAAAGALRADDAPSDGDTRARDIFRKAVHAQGKLRAQDVSDVRIEFRGQVVEEGEHSVKREYRYRSEDRSFYLLTAPTAAPERRTERGVLGGGGFWERGSGGRVFDLQPGNREDEKAIRSIRKERDQFERILRLVLLARLEDETTRIRLAEPAPVLLESDLPQEANAILGRDRGERTYAVLSVERDGEPRIDLWVRADEPAKPGRDTGYAWTVVKAVQYDPKNAVRPEWFYYFGPYDRDAHPDLLLPRYFSAHKGAPVDEESKKKTLKYHGVLEVRLNTGLKDADLRPPE